MTILLLFRNFADDEVIRKFQEHKPVSAEIISVYD